MNLETAQSIAIDSVTADQLRQAMRDDAGRGEFIILSSSPQTYMQASGEGNGPYALEYRDDDDDHHFSADGRLSRDDVERAFLWYLAGDARWRSEFTWSKLEQKPWWKLW